MSADSAPETCWLNRAGIGGEHADAFVVRGMISLDWAGIEGLDDLRDHDAESMRLRLAAAQRGQPRGDVRELLAFRDEMQIGDVIVTPDPARKDLLFATVDGDYEFSPTPVVGDHRHSRAVTWHGRWSRAGVADHLRKPLDDYKRTVLRLPDQEEWRAIAARIRDGAGAPAQPPAAATRRTAQVTRAAAMHAPGRTCPGCGIDRGRAMFEPGSALCRDCA